MRRNILQVTKLAAAVAAVGAAIPATVAAQSTTAALPTQTTTAAVPAQTTIKATPAATQNVLSINPLGVVFEVFSGEYERAVGSNISLGLAGTLWRSGQDYEDASGSADASVNYLSTDVKLRYYPATVLRGFSIGGLVGATRLGGDVRACDETTCEQVDGREIALSTGVEIDYAWRLGGSQKFFIATGLGAKRLFPLSDDVDVTLAYPFARLSVGFGF